MSPFVRSRQNHLHLTPNKNGVGATRELFSDRGKLSRTRSSLVLGSPLFSEGLLHSRKLHEDVGSIREVSADGSSLEGELSNE